MKEQNPINYKIRSSYRARKIRITVSCDGAVMVTQPVGMPDQRILDFVSSKMSWIRQKLDFFSKIDWSQRIVLPNRRGEYLKYKTQVRALVKERLEYYNQSYNFSYNRIFIRNQKTRWGSCSGNRNLSFNYKLIFLSERQRDYVIVHELCHLKEFNHSKRFWDLVKQHFPDYPSLRAEIRKLR